jgi:sugar phosphate isomerase/epimerase
MKKSTRREFFKQAATLGVAASTLNLSKVYANNANQAKFKLGMASYTFRKFSLDECIAMTNRVGLKHISLKSHHLPYESSLDDIKNLASKVRNAGLDLYGCGVVYMKDEKEVHRAFEYAKAGGIGIIIGVPEHDLLKLVDKKVKEYDIKVAIHNHGPGDKRYPSPVSAYERIKDLDKRIGLCIDVGHSQRIGLDPAKDIINFSDRLLDLHIKDVSASTEEGKTVEIGRGVINIPKILRTLDKINYQGITAIEFEKDAEDPLPGVAESVGYVRGVLAGAEII